MIYTLTLAPAWDITHWAPSVKIGLNRAGDACGKAGGKGINVSRAIRRAGGDCVTLAALAGDTGQRLAGVLQKEGIVPVVFPTEGETRTNVSLIGDDGQSLEINAAGTPLNADCVQNLALYLADTLRDGDILCLCGSLPKIDSVEGSLYTHLCRGAGMVGAKAVLDCSGGALADALRCECPPCLIKPNLEELTELAGIADAPSQKEIALEDVRKIAASAADLSRTAVLCTLGSRGAVWMDAGETVFVPARQVERPRAEKGAGDTFLGVFLWHRFALGADVRTAMTAASEAAAALVRGDESAD